MFIVVEVTVAGDERPPEGAVVRVEVRDTSVADAPAVTLGSASGRVRGHGSWLETVEVEAELDDRPAGCTVFAHVDVDGDGRVSPGDYLTTQSYPVPPGSEPRLSVEVRPI